MTTSLIDEMQEDLNDLADSYEQLLAERDRLREVNAELVEALNAVVSAYESPPHGLNWMEAVAINMKNVRAAIAKAEGREK